MWCLIVRRLAVRTYRRGAEDRRSACQEFSVFGFQFSVFGVDCVRCVVRAHAATKPSNGWKGSRAKGGFRWARSAFSCKWRCAKRFGLLHGHCSEERVSNNSWRFGPRDGSVKWVERVAGERRFLVGAQRVLAQ